MNTDKENQVAANGANFSGIGNDFPGGVCLPPGGGTPPPPKAMQTVIFLGPLSGGNPTD
jgi:hypothetical protein